MPDPYVARPVCGQQMSDSYSDVACCVMAACLQVQRLGAGLPPTLEELMAVELMAVPGSDTSQSFTFSVLSPLRQLLALLEPQEAQRLLTQAAARAAGSH